MKTKFANKFITLILSVVMIATLCVGFSVTAFAAEADYTAPAAGEAKIYGANVNLGGDIAMKYHVEIGSNIDINKLVLKVEFLGMVKELTYSATEGNYYIFELDGITPQCMGDTINAQLVYDGNELTCANASKDNYSVKQNLENLYNDSATNEQTKQLIIDTLEYGAAAQKYRDYKTDALVTADFAPANSDTDVTVPAKDSVLDDKSANVDIVSANVRYSTINYLLFRLNGSDDFTGKVSINGSAVTGTMEDGYYVVSTGAISPEDFAKDFTVKYDNGADDYVSLTYSVNDYCYTAANGTSAEMSGLANALYNYGLSAHLYLGEHVGGTATCTHGKLCDVCGTEYDITLDTNNHASDVYTYTDNGDGTHTKVHECGVTVDNAEAHSYDMSTGKCACGEYAVAKVGDTYYKTFDEAVSAWTDGTTLTLLDDVTGKSTIDISGKSVTFDMNGHTYSMSSWMFKVKEGASLVITDSSSEGNGLLNYTGSGGWAIISEGNLTFAGGKATSVARDETVYISAGTFQMTGGTVENTGGNNALLIDSYQGSVTSVLISGGTFSGKTDDIIVYDSPVTISGTVYFDSIVIDSQYYDTYQSVANFKDAENADGWKIHSQYCPLTVGTQLILPDNMELQVDTLPVTVLNPGYVGVISHPHSGGNATCGAQAICDICSKPYGTTPAHSFDETGKCSGCGQQATMSVTNGTNTYYALDAASLNTAVTDLLNTGERTFTVNLPANAEAKLFTAIRRALIDTEGVADGSVNLTLTGVTAIPDHDEMDPSTAIFGAYLGNEMECVTQLVSISLPDVLTIGNYAFDWCENIVSLTAPKVQTVGDWAFAYTGITEIELPEATTLGWVAFCPCEDLISVKLPKAVSLGQQAFDNCNSLTYVELTAVDGITFSSGVFDSTGNIDLVLNCSKASEITDNVTWNGYTFKSITLQHNGELEYKDNGNGTHDQKYSCCGTVSKDDEAHTLTYSTNNGVITASCSANCGASGSVTINATSKTYDGTTAVNVDKTGVMENIDVPVSYTKDGEAFTGEPVDAGSYTASITLGDQTVSVEFAIIKADPEYTVPTGLTANLGQTLADVTLPDGWEWADSSLSVGAEGDNQFEATFTPADTANYNTVTEKLTVTVSKASASVTTAPAAVENLQYTGEAQALVTAGEASGGTIQYKLGEDGTYSTTIPTASAVGEYTVYWKVVGDENHGDTAEQSITVTISAKAVTEDNVTVSNLDASYTYTGEAIVPEITITVGGKTLVAGTDYDVTYSNNTYVSPNAKVTITFKGNYSGTVEVYFTITAQEGTDDFTSDWMPVE